MIDFHTHILPGIDDGSSDVEESLKMLHLMHEQGITRVVATPHFDVDKTSVEKFLEDRRESFSLVEAQKFENAPEIILGAEVSYYSGIEHLENINELCIKGTNLLLIEMPTTSWSKTTIDSITALTCRGDINVIIAHIERYFFLQKETIWRQLLQNGVIMQSNASFFEGIFSKNKALRLLKEGYIHVIGSDSHNFSSRKPNIDIAYDAINKKMGNEFLTGFINFSEELLNNKIF